MKRNSFHIPRARAATQFRPPGAPPARKWNWGSFEKPVHLYQSTRWRAVREVVLSATPVCGFCGCLADQVHHIHPGEELFYDAQNLFAICERCHVKVNSFYRGKGDKTILFGERGSEKWREARVKEFAHR